MKIYFPYFPKPLHLYSLLSIFIAGAFWLVIENNLNNLAFSQTFTPSPPANRGETFACNEQNLEILTTQLLRDLPSYANRASQRGRRHRRSSDIYSYMLLAGRPEFQPLPLNPASNYTDGQKSAAEVEQVFFTTLARQYVDGKAVELQEFHWLFLTKTQLGWRLVLMFSQIGDYPKQQPPTPPRDSSNGTVAQGIKAWLRDCQAGSVRIRTRV